MNTLKVVDIFMEGFTVVLTDVCKMGMIAYL